jgi:hypothetical protein
LAITLGHADSMDALRRRDYPPDATEMDGNAAARRGTMGDKGGKRDKTKEQKQKAVKKEQEDKRKLDKQPKKKA